MVWGQLPAWTSFPVLLPAMAVAPTPFVSGNRCSPDGVIRPTPALNPAA
jgi:hypothetical protein